VFSDAVQIVAVPQRERVALPVEDDRLPPAVVEGFLGDDQMASPDLVPGLGQSGTGLIREIIPLT